MNAKLQEAMNMLAQVFGVDPKDVQMFKGVEFDPDAQARAHYVDQCMDLAKKQITNGDRAEIQDLLTTAAAALIAATVRATKLIDEKAFGEALNSIRTTQDKAVAACAAALQLAGERIFTVGYCIALTDVAQGKISPLPLPKLYGDDWKPGDRLILKNNLADPGKAPDGFEVGTICTLEKLLPDGMCQIKEWPPREGFEARFNRRRFEAVNAAAPEEFDQANGADAHAGLAREIA